PRIFVRKAGFEPVEQSFQIGSDFDGIDLVHLLILRGVNTHEGRILHLFQQSEQYQFIAL
ncbi:MAG: hypothetical protein ACRC2T_02795, partial [Thermoguttaceae bacterium]